MQKKHGVTTVPQFGGWDQSAPGATDYSMVFTQARAKKKQQKIDLTDIKRHSLGNEREFINANRGHHHAHQGLGHAHHGHGHAYHGHGHGHAHEEPIVMVRP